jgi:hypothetical protein
MKGVPELQQQILKGFQFIPRKGDENVLAKVLKFVC